MLCFESPRYLISGASHPERRETTGTVPKVRVAKEAAATALAAKEAAARAAARARVAVVMSETPQA